MSRDLEDDGRGRPSPAAEPVVSADPFERGIRRGTEVAGIEEGPDQVRLHLSGGETVATAR
ncbi:hypothetical protein, partial [Phaeovulum vinaykumarii]|uniref:hypothetical protein n=1 Tax=Phaeovulum vinaykumarii TaxID=407234 RepID=UPI001AEC93C0